MEVDEQLDARSIAQLVDEGSETMVLGRVGGGFAFVGRRAGVGACAAWVRGPAEGPVAVYVAAVAGRGDGAWLSVFAPEAVVLLGVDEA